MLRPMLTKREFEQFVPNRVLNGDHKLSRRQWDHVKESAHLLMDKDHPTSPMGGINKEEIEEFGDYLSKNKHITFSPEQVEKVKAIMHEYAK